MPYGNSYSKPLDETQVNGTNSKRNNAINGTKLPNTGERIFGVTATNGYGRSGTANAGYGVKDAMNMNQVQVPAPRIATTNVRVSLH